MKSILRSMDRPTLACLAFLLLASAASLGAQEPPPEQVSGEDEGVVEPEATADDSPTDEVAIEPACTVPEPRIVTLPKLTQLYISVDALLGSKLSATGESFPITVVEPLVFEGEELIPVGTRGQGEVIHAKKAGASGSGGELILTANFIELDGRQIPLRSMQLGLTGKDQGGLAMATGMVAGPFGFLVRGKNIDVAEGSPAGAKLAEDTQFLLEPSEGAVSEDCMEGT